MNLQLPGWAPLTLLIGAACGGPIAVNDFGRENDRADCPQPTFQGHHVIVEAHPMEASNDHCWWLSSGAMLFLDPGVARSIQGQLPAPDEWRRHYARSNPVDTDDGANPQNLLRLVSRTHWRDFRQAVYFRINRINASASRQRGEWSGVFLMLRYLDADNLYYAGLRVDGAAVIKKKYQGRYVTLATQPAFQQNQAYDRDSNPSLLPHGRWIGLASVVDNEPDGSVRIELLFRDEGAPTEWKTAVTARDDGLHGPPLREPGRAGLRSDFMDVEFADYSARNR